MEQGKENKYIEKIDIYVKKLFIAVLHKLGLVIIVGMLFAACAGLITVYLIEPIESIKSFTYNLHKNMAISGFIGLLLTSSFMVINHLINNSNSSISDIEKYFGFNALSIKKEEETRGKKASKAAKIIKIAKKIRKDVKAIKQQL